MIDNIEPTDPALEEGSERSDSGPAAQLARIALRIHSDAISRGERAELRRMKADGIPPEVYWRLTDGLTWPRGKEQSGGEFDRFWMAVLPLMVHNPHAATASPGRMLSRAGVKASRIERWLRRDREAAWQEAPRILSIASGLPISWSRFGYLLFGWDQPEIKREFARDFFRAERRAEHANRNEGETTDDR